FSTVIVPAAWAVFMHCVVWGIEDFRPTELIHNFWNIIKFNFSKDYRSQGKKNPVGMSRATRNVNYWFINSKLLKHTFVFVGLCESNSSIVCVLGNIAICRGDSSPAGTGSDCNDSNCVL